MARNASASTSAPLLLAFLRQLPHVGAGGFEGFVGRLLEHATGIRFRIAWSGRQQGRDNASEAEPGDISACRYNLEAKHYFSSALNQRELVAEIAQAARQARPPDLWILVTPTEVDPTNLEELRTEAADRGFDVLALDGKDRGLGRLVALAAAHLEAVVGFAREHATPVDLVALETELAAIVASARFAAVHAQITRALDGTLLGHADAVRRARRCLLKVLGDGGYALSRFNQDVAVRRQGSGIVRRRELHAALQKWLSDATLGASQCGVVLGEDGVGKSWATFDWLATFVESDEMETVVLPFSASMKPYPAHMSLADLLPDLLEQWTGIAGRELWSRRLARWLSRGQSAGHPLLLVAADGLSERTDVQWPSFMASAAEPDWRGRVAVLVTDRPRHWMDRCPAMASMGFGTIAELRGFSDDELNDATSGFDRRAVPEEVLPLLRLPRYCGLVRDHLDELVASGDFTKARLHYLEARSKHIDKLRHPVTEADFASIVRKAATKHREAVSRFDPDQISKLTPPGASPRDVFQELLTGSLFVDAGRGRLAVDPSKLAYGLGLLLAEEMAELEEEGAPEEAVADAIARWFEPERAADLKVEAAAAALFHAALDPSYPAGARRQLLIYWLGLRNWEDDTRAALSRYVVRIPEDFVAAAEHVWSAGVDGGAAQAFLATAFMAWRDDIRVLPHLVRAATRWLGFVHAEGHVMLRARGTMPRSGPSREVIAERLGEPAADGSHIVFATGLRVIEDDGLLRLRRLALLVASTGPRAPFVRGLAAWSVSSAIQDWAAEAKEVAWLLRLADDDIEGPLVSECRLLLTQRDPLADEAARHLLRALGSVEANRLLKAHPPPLDENWERRMRDHDASPCESPFALDQGQCAFCLGQDHGDAMRLIEKCRAYLSDPNVVVSEGFLDSWVRSLEGLDPAMMYAAGQRGIQDHVYDLLEAGLAGRRPATLAAFWQTVAGSLPGRDVEGCRWFGGAARKVAPLMSPAEISLLTAASARLDAAANAKVAARPPGSPYSQEHFAAFCVLSAAMSGMSPGERWRALAGRPDDAFDGLDLAIWFATPEGNDMDALVEALNNEGATGAAVVRALWFGAFASPPIGQALAGRVLRLSSGGADETTGGAATLFASLAGDATLARAAADAAGPCPSGGSWLAVNRAALLLRHGAHLTIAEVAPMLHPATLSFLVVAQRRGDDDVGAAADAFHACWLRMSANAGDGRTLPELLGPSADGETGVGWPEMRYAENRPLSIVRSDSTWLNRSHNAGEKLKAQFHRPTEDEQDAEIAKRTETVTLAWREEAYSWLGRGFDPKGLRLFLSVRPGYGAIWAGPALDQGATGLFHRRRLETFHPSLLVALFDAGDPAAPRLWRCLADEVGRNLPLATVAAAPFVAEDSTASLTAREEIFAACRSDTDLAEVAVLAQLNSRQAWLDATVATHLAAVPLWRRAKGLTLAAHAHGSAEAWERLLQTGGLEGTWAGKVLGYLRRASSDDRHARHWYREFLETENAITAWGAFQMFLRAVDGRWRVWAPGMAASARPERLLHARSVRNDIEAAVRQKRDERKKTFLTIQTPKGEVEPFAMD